MSRILAIANIKGGVGKTTTTANLSAALAARGCRVLAVDLDPQASLTVALGFSPEALLRTVRGALGSEGQALGSIVVPTRENFDLAPANHGLRTVERELENGRVRPFALRDALESARGSYDYILLDCPANAGILTGNALAAAGEVVIPFPPDFLDLQTVDWIIQLVREVKARLNPDLRIMGFLLAMYTPRTRLTRDMIKTVRERHGLEIPFFSAAIPLDDRLREAPRAGQTVLRYAPESSAAAAYARLAREIEEGIPEPEPVDAVGAVRSARGALERGDRVSAYRDYRTAAELKPDLLEAWTGRARTAPDEIEALRCWARALEIDPGSAEARAELASRLTTRLAASTREDIGTLISLAGSMIEMGHPLYAELILRRATALEPAHSGAWLGRARAAVDPKAALEFAERAQALAPDDPEVRSEHVAALARVRSTSETLVRQALESFASGKRDKAHEQYRRAVELDPQNDRAWLGLARTSDDQGEALEFVENALRINPENGEARTLYHWLYAPEKKIIPFPIPLRMILSIVIAILILVAAIWVLWRSFQI